MKTAPILRHLLLLVAPGLFVAPSHADDEPAEVNAGFARTVQPLLRKYCLNCHNADVQKAEFTVHDLRGNVGTAGELQRWEKIHEMLDLGLMPPKKRPQPPKEDVEHVVRWIDQELTKVGRAPDTWRVKLPQFGNRVHHADLFSGKHKGPAFSYARVWRISPDIYAQMAKDNGIVRHSGPQGLADALADGLAPVSEKGIQDFALLRADEATLRILINSSRTIATRMTVGKVIPGTRKGKNPKPARIDKNNRVFRDLAMLDAETATDVELDHALDRSFVELLQRKPNAAERDRYGALLRKSVKIAGPMKGFQNLLMALLMSPEFIFRMELGLGARLPDGRRMLSPRELAYAIAYALDDRPPDTELRKAAAEGRLSSRVDVEREVRRMYDQYDDVHTYFTVPMEDLGSKSDPYNARPLRFFRQFFGYHRAPTVFKDAEHSKGRVHRAEWLVKDADRFVLEILDRDQNVFHDLLTSDRYFVAYVPPKHVERAIRGMLRTRGKKKGDPRTKARVERGEYPVPRPFGAYIGAYNLDKDTWNWQPVQPFQLPNRAGMLTHPAWLVAHSGNFDNDPIRRGKWIREHLLAGNVPDLPIGVEAKLPEDPHKTLRERMEVTRAESCWRCHRQMNPLGLPFEEFDDFGTHRTRIVLEQEHKKRGKVIIPAVTRPVDTRGELTGTGDLELDGAVDGARDLIGRLAKSERVRQSMIRHVFRYWMGRNETLRDSPTLIAMDRAYLESGGSFKELLVTLLTSDSFLYRKDPPE